MLDNKGFDLWADGYDKSVGISDEDNTYPFAGYKEILGSIYKTIMKKSNPAVLDIGFGTGTLTAKLYENGCEIFGQDFSSKMIELASAKMPNAHLYQGDFAQGLAEALKRQSYDFIVMTYSIHHLRDDQKIAFLKELLDYLKETAQKNGMSHEKLEALYFINGCVAESYMLRALEALDESYGGAVGYLREELGVGEAEIKHLREKYLE